MLSAEKNHELSVECAKRLLTWFHQAWQDDPKLVIDAAKVIEGVYDDYVESKVIEGVFGDSC